jgi:ankyrin repeat protein
MRFTPQLLSTSAIFMAVALHGQQSVCELFGDLKASEGRQLTISGELIISKDIAAIGAADCDKQYISDHQLWPTGLALRPSAKAPPEQIRRLREAAAAADSLRRAGKTVSASASFTGRVLLHETGGFPGEFSFDSIEGLTVETLPDAGELPVIPICDLFQTLGRWKGQRIAVRGEVVGTSEGSWLIGRCSGNFSTNGYRWPVGLSYAGPAYYSHSIAPLIRVKQPSSPPKGFDAFRGRYSVVRTATYVGRLRMRDEYIAVCRLGGDYITNGFGHLNGAAAEIVVEEVRDVELAKANGNVAAEPARACEPPNLAVVCSTAALSQAAGLGCATRVAELLARNGIDSKDSSESEALGLAIQGGNEVVVKLLLNAGAPVNPPAFRLFSPLGEAAHRRRLDVMKTLLKAGANVDAVDHQGATYLAGYGYFDESVLKILLDAGANPNAADSDGRTALMQASYYGYEGAVVLLMEHGAEIDLRDHKGRSPLMYAANGKYVDAIPHLLDHGANPQARDSDGKTALDLARQSKNAVAIELLSAAMQ